MQLMVDNHYSNSKDIISGLDPKYKSDADNYWPNTEHSITLDFKKEFIRHKRVICSLKEFNEYDVQNKWDITFCKAFCSDGNQTMFGDRGFKVVQSAKPSQPLTAQEQLPVAPELIKINNQQND